MCVCVCVFVWADFLKQSKGENSDDTLKSHGSTIAGVALLRMVLELPADGKAFALDVQDDYVKVGKPIMEKAGVLSKVC